MQLKTQLIAHDKEVYDMGFTSGTDVFASVGADGSVRMFDLRYNFSKHLVSFLEILNILQLFSKLLTALRSSDLHGTNKITII